jgi:F-type H+-transporting ATPase subunit epsilon
MDDNLGSLKLSIISPENILFSENVDMVVIPGSEGDFGVMPGHAAFIANIRPGIISIYNGENIFKKIFIYSGIAEVSDNICSILAEYAIDVEEINREQLVKDIEQLTDYLSKTDETDANLLLKTEQLTKAKSMLQVI